MLLQRFLTAIEKSAVFQNIEKRKDFLVATDPRRFYVENVRSFLGVPTSFARLLCEMAVRDGLFRKKIGLVCPICQRIIISVYEGEPLQENFVCEVCEMNEEEKFEYRRSELTPIVFYEINKPVHAS